MKYKIIRKHKKDVRDFEIGYADSKEQADGLLAYYSETNEDEDCYYIKWQSQRNNIEKRRGVNSDR